MGDDGALRFGEQLRAVAADLDHMGFECFRIAGVDAVLKNIPNGFICPELSHLVAAPDFCQIGGRSLGAGRIQPLRNLCDADALRGPLKYLPDDIGGRRINYDSVLLLTLLIAVRYSAKGIFTIQLLRSVTLLILRDRSRLYNWFSRLVMPSSRPPVDSP